MHDRCSSKGIHSATVGDANDINAMRQPLEQISYALAQSRSLAPAAYTMPVGTVNAKLIAPP